MGNNMYEKIFVPVDNSAHSESAVDIAVRIAAELGGRLFGGHAYAAGLHDMRFRQMETMLPEEYLEESDLEKQRHVHDSLITKGLELISDSYLVSMAEKAGAAGVDFEARTYNGRNFEVLAADINTGAYDLVVLGALGQGAVEKSQIGSVCERILRRTSTDTLVIKTVEKSRDHGTQAGGIVVAIDGSYESFAGLRTASELARRFQMPIEAVSVFDAHLHQTLFQSVEKVLTEKAADVFNFKEQEKLHKTVIDEGLAKIYRSHLETARRITAKDGIDLQVTLLEGKVFQRLLEHIDVVNPWLLVVGRIGAHSDDKMDMGSNTENLLRQAPCNVLLSSRRFVPDADHQEDEELTWSEDALVALSRIPEGIMRKMTKDRIEKLARESKTESIDLALVEKGIAEGRDSMD